jgi:hypothetical protein
MKSDAPVVVDIDYISEMSLPARPLNEASRLQELRDLQLFDTTVEPVFDNFAVHHRESNGRFSFHEVCKGNCNTSQTEFRVAVIAMHLKRSFFYTEE